MLLGRLLMSRNVVNPTENRRILSVSQPGANHKAGQILFGLDGFLYIMFGDGGGFGNAASQMLNSPLGKVLRIAINVDSQSPGLSKLIKLTVQRTLSQAQILS